MGVGCVVRSNHGVGPPSKESPSMSSLGFFIRAAISDGNQMNSLRFALKEEDFSVGQDCRSWICHLKLDTQDPGHIVFAACFTEYRVSIPIIY